MKKVLCFAVLLAISAGCGSGSASENASEDELQAYVDAHPEAVSTPEEDWAREQEFAKQEALDNAK